MHHVLCIIPPSSSSSSCVRALSLPPPLPRPTPSLHGSRFSPFPGGHSPSFPAGIGNPYIGNPTGNPQLVAGGAGSAQMRSRPGMKRSRDSPGGSSPTQAAKMVGYEELPSYAELVRQWSYVFAVAQEAGGCSVLSAHTRANYAAGGGGGGGG